MNNKIRLTESKLHRVISESVKIVLNESHNVLAKDIRLNGRVFQKGEDEMEVKDRLSQIFGGKWQGIFKHYFTNDVWALRRDKFDSISTPKIQKSKWSFDALQIPKGSTVYYKSVTPREIIPFTVVGSNEIERQDNGKVYTPLNFTLERRDKTFGYNGYQHFFIKADDFPKLREVGKEWMSLQKYGRTFFGM